MKIKIESNFAIPGFQGKDLEVKEGTTLRQLLREIERISEERLEFFRGGSEQLDSEDWAVSINGIPFCVQTKQLETLLADDDLVTVNIEVIGGG